MSQSVFPYAAREIKEGLVPAMAASRLCRSGHAVVGVLAGVACLCCDCGGGSGCVRWGGQALRAWTWFKYARGGRHTHSVGPPRLQAQAHFTSGGNTYKQRQKSASKILLLRPGVLSSPSFDSLTDDDVVRCAYRGSFDTLGSATDGQGHGRQPQSNPRHL